MIDGTADRLASFNKLARGDDGAVISCQQVKRGSLVALRPKLCSCGQPERGPARIGRYHSLYSSNAFIGSAKRKQHQRAMFSGIGNDQALFVRYGKRCERIAGTSAKLCPSAQHRDKETKAIPRIERCQRKLRAAPIAPRNTFGKQQQGNVGRQRFLPL